MTPQRMREAANLLGEFVNGEIANELIAFADKLERDIGHSSWVWNRHIIEEIRYAVGPGAPALDVDLAEAVRRKFQEPLLAAMCGADPDKNCTAAAPKAGKGDAS